jgi:hypothetical protein
MSDKRTDWLNLCPTNWLTVCSSDRVFGGLTDGLAHLLTDWPIDWHLYIGCLIDWLDNRFDG